MIRKLNLKNLYASGELSASLQNVTEHSSSAGITSIFNSDIDNENNFLSFKHQYPFPKLKLEFTTTQSLDNVYINVVTQGTRQFQAAFNGSSHTDTVRKIDPFRSSQGTDNTLSQFVVPDQNSLQKIEITFQISQELSASPINEHRVRYVELYYVDDKNPFDFNDSVLTTKGWNSSRYDGKQLQANEINRATVDDIGNNSRTPILQEYSRNIYIGSRIIGMQAGNIEDATLLNIDGFSYVTVHEYITVNDDLTITKRTVRGDKPDTGFNNKKGFYNSWYHDFPVGSTCEIKVLDRKVEQSLKPSYEIYNNSGQLQKLLLVHQTNRNEGGYAASYRPYTVWSDPNYDPGSDNIFYYATESLSIGDINYKTGANFRIYNKTELIDPFFTGSLIGSEPPYYSGGTGQFEGEYDSGEIK